MDCIFFICGTSRFFGIFFSTFGVLHTFFCQQVLAQTESDVDMQLPGITEPVRSQQWVAPASKVRGRVRVIGYARTRDATPLHSYGNPISP